jgi:hypothetical protein
VATDVFLTLLRTVRDELTGGATGVDKRALSDSAPCNKLSSNSPSSARMEEVVVSMDTSEEVIFFELDEISVWSVYGGEWGDVGHFGQVDFVWTS